MDLKKFSLQGRSRGKRKKGDTTQLAAQLAPLEEQDKRIDAKQIGTGATADKGQVERGSGAIVVDNDNMNFPREITEERGEQTFWGMEPVVLAILIVMLVFIAFIAWQISLMPVVS